MVDFRGPYIHVAPNLMGLSEHTATGLSSGAGPGVMHTTPTGNIPETLR